MENKENKNAFSLMEEEVLAFWDKAKTFEKSVNKEAPQGDYVFYDGPPFGTGEPHYGHILSSVTKDVVPRYWTMKGYRVERRWGWDCHGLPIENIIEKQMNINGKKQIEEKGIDIFNEACRSQVLNYADVWDIMVRRIGRWVDFKNSYKTMDLSFMESVWWAFKELYKKDLVYEGRKVLLYCPRCETPISNFEVAMDNSYKDIRETSVYVKFKVKKESIRNPEILRSAQDDNLYILAWTTTPWTLPGNVALAVGADIDYVLVKSFVGQGVKELDALETPPVVTEEYKHYILCKDKYELIFGEKGELAKVITEFKGKDLVGLEYEPLFDVPALKNSGKKAYYVAAADFVSTEDGTGVVHTAVVYGEDDYNLGLKLDLPVVPALDEKGHFNETVPQFKGVYFKKANGLVIEDLEKRGLLFKKEDINHSYPHCHRCDTQLFYNALPAWFINIQKLKPQLLEQNKNINWYPEHLKEGRFAKGIEQAPDWNISRNRYFATPIPVWRCDSCKKLEVVGSVEELKNKTGISEVKDIHSHNIDNLTWKCDCGGEMKRISEVFDCWVESGSMSFAQHHYPFENKEKFESTFPAQFISEYISQTRAWFYVMHVMSVALFGKNSFENVVANGVILNEKGEKMSKSKKNYPDPWKVINEFGVDSLRFYLMNSTLMHADNLFFNERELGDIFRKNIMILWNVYKFYEMFATELKVESYKVESNNVLDQWILTRLNQLIAEITGAMDGYDLPRATRPITAFIDDLSTWYIRRSRDRFKDESKEDKKAALETTGYVLLTLSKLIAPFMPFMAENLWQRLSGNNFEDENKSVHLESWPTSHSMEHIAHNNILVNMEIVRKIVELGLAKRDEAGIKVRQPLSQLSIVNCQLSDEFVDLVKDELNVKEVKCEKGEGEISVELDLELTEELKLEGVKREVVRFVNALRKDAGLSVQDKVNIYWQSEGENLKKAIGLFKAEILKDTLAVDLIQGEVGENKKEVKVNGEGCVLGVKKV
jgi:isoleucyl-tRNA synthetase